MKARHVVAAWVTFSCTVITATALLPRAPASPRGTFPDRLSASEIVEIETAVRRERYARSVRFLRAGEFAEAWRWLNRSRAQKVWDVGEQPDGGLWLHVGVDRETARRSMTGRFILRRQTGRWVITASNF